MAQAGAAKTKNMTLRGHLLELRNRFFLVFGVLVVAATIAYVYRDPLIAGLLAPLEGRQLQYLTPGGGFKFIFSVVFFSGLAIAIPLLIQQIYAFLSPVLSDTVRSRSGWILLWSPILLAIGVTFGYIYAVPGALDFLYGFADDFIVSAMTADAYLDFVIKYTLGLGLMFQIPLIMAIIHWIKPQKPLKLLKFERWVILIAFILAAIITPTPDPVNQTMIAVPIVAVYQIGLFAICMNIWKSGRALRRERRLERKQLRKEAKRPRKAAVVQRKPVEVPAVQPTPAPVIAVQPAKPKPIMDVYRPVRHTATPTQLTQAVEAAAPSVPERPVVMPRRSIDGVVRSSGNRQPVRPPVQPVVVAPERPVPTLPRTARPNVRRPLSIDGMTRMVSA